MNTLTVNELCKISGGALSRIPGLTDLAKYIRKLLYNLYC